MEDGRRRTWLRVGAVVAVVLSLLAAWRFGVLDVSSDAERLRDALRGLGAGGYAAYLGVFSFLQPFGIPGFVLVLGATYVWPAPVAFVLAFAGAMGASVVGFFFARFVARDWVSARLPPRIKAYDARIESRGLLAVVLIRLVFWMNPFAHGVLGLSRVRLSTYLVGSAIGYAPSIAGIVWLGGPAIDALRALPIEGVATGIGGVVAVFFAWRLWAWRTARRAAASPTPATGE